MLAELSIIPVGGSPHSSGELAKVLKLVEKSGLAYQLNPQQLASKVNGTKLCL